MRPAIAEMKRAAKGAGDEPPWLPPVQMLREDFEAALTLAIEIQARHEFDEWRMRCARIDPRFNTGTGTPPVSSFLQELRTVLKASKDKRKIEIVEEVAP